MSATVTTDEIEAIVDAGRSETGDDHLVPSAGDVAFTWDYERSRDGLSRLYEKAKTSQWNASTDLPWDTPVDQEKMAAALGSRDSSREFRERIAQYE